MNVLQRHLVPASHGIFSLGYHPSIVQTQNLFTPETSKRLFGKLAAMQARHVPSTCFLNITTAYSSFWLQVYFTLKTTMGFAAFPRKLTVQTNAHFPFSRNAVHTPRRIPLISSRTASLRPLPSCRYFAYYVRLTVYTAVPCTALPKPRSLKSADLTFPQALRACLPS